MIQVQLPASRGEVRYMPSFEGDLSNFALNMDHISALRFGDVILKTTNNYINVRVIILLV